MLPVRPRKTVHVRGHGKNVWMPIASVLKKNLVRSDYLSCLMIFFGLVPALKCQIA